MPSLHLVPGAVPVTIRSSPMRLPALLLVTFLTACSSRAEVPDDELPPYTPSEAALFDDTIDPAVLAPKSSHPPLQDHAKLIERTHRSDRVFQARITTVSRSTASPGQAFSLTVEPTRALAGPLPKGPVSLSLSAGSPTAARIERGEALVGRTLVIFLKRHWGASGVEAHFRGEPDSPAVLSAVERAAKALDESGS